MNEHIIKAALLYRDALKENDAEVEDIVLANYKMCYIPNMPHCHRTMWIEENIYIFYIDPSDEYGPDVLRASDAPDGTKRRLFCNPVSHLDLEKLLTEEYCYNIKIDVRKVNLPFYLETNHTTLLKVAKLLAFS